MGATEEFAELMGRPAPEVRLDRGALLIAAHARPDVDVERRLGELDRIADGVRGPTLDYLVRHLFVDEGFRGDREHYYDPRNSFLDQVLARRLGIPLSLSVLMMEVGRRIGVPLAGVGMPGHFLLQDKVDRSVFVDAFARGAFITAADAERTFLTVNGAGAVWDPSYLEPVGAIEILTRMLSNLKASFLRADDKENLRWVLRLRTLIPGMPIQEHRQLARVLATLGEFREAASVYDQLAGLDPERANTHSRRASRLRATLN